MSNAVATYEQQFEHARLKIKVLEEHLRLRRIAKYGPGSEKLSNLQLQLLEEEPGVSQQEVAAESEREAPPAQEEKEEEKKKQQRSSHPGRQTLPPDLPRVEKVLACTPEQCVCGNCGKETVVIGYETSEVLKVKPAEYFVEVTKREKRACKQCEEQGVVSAPLPARIIDKGLVSDEIIIVLIAMNWRPRSVNFFRPTEGGFPFTLFEGGPPLPLDINSDRFLRIFAHLLSSG
jgi:transposase